jgi:hypothetical protein
VAYCGGHGLQIRAIGLQIRAIGVLTQYLNKSLFSC